MYSKETPIGSHLHTTETITSSLLTKATFAISHFETLQSSINTDIDDILVSISAEVSRANAQTIQNRLDSLITAKLSLSQTLLDLEYSNPHNTLHQNNLLTRISRISDSIDRIHQTQTKTTITDPDILPISLQYLLNNDRNDISLLNIHYDKLHSFAISLADRISSLRDIEAYINELNERNKNGLKDNGPDNFVSIGDAERITATEATIIGYASQLIGQYDQLGKLTNMLHYNEATNLTLRSAVKDIRADLSLERSDKKDLILAKRVNNINQKKLIIEDKLDSLSTSSANYNLIYDKLAKKITHFETLLSSSETFDQKIQNNGNIDQIKELIADRNIKISELKSAKLAALNSIRDTSKESKIAELEYAKIVDRLEGLTELFQLHISEHNALGHAPNEGSESSLISSILQNALDKSVRGSVLADHGEAKLDYFSTTQHDAKTDTVSVAHTDTSSKSDVPYINKFVDDYVAQIDPITTAGTIQAAGAASYKPYFSNDIQFILSYGQSLSTGDTQQAPISRSAPYSGRVLEALPGGGVVDYSAAQQSEKPIIGALNRIAKNFEDEGQVAPILIGADVGAGGRSIVELLLGSDDEYQSISMGMSSTQLGEFFYVDTDTTNSKGHAYYNIYMNDGNEGGIILENRTSMGHFDRLEESLYSMKAHADNNGLEIIENIFFSWIQGQSEPSGGYVSLDYDRNGNGRYDHGETFHHARGYSDILEELVEKVNSAAEEIIGSDVQIISVVGQQSGNPKSAQIGFVANTDNSYLGAQENTYQREHADGINYIDGSLRDNDTTHLNSLGYNLLGQDTGQAMYEIMTDQRHEDEFMYMENILVNGAQLIVSFANVKGQLISDASDYDGVLYRVTDELAETLGFQIHGRSTIFIQNAKITNTNEVTITLNQELTSADFRLSVSPQTLLRDDGIVYEAHDLYQNTQIEGETLPQYVPAHTVHIDSLGLIKSLYDGPISNSRQRSTGTDGNDEILGSSDSDIIFGGDGDDTIMSSAGNDVLVGNTGADSFIYDSISGIDRIHDFDLTDGDIIDVSLLLDRYIPSDGNLSKFVQVNTIDSNTSQLLVNRTGIADNYELVTIIDHSESAIEFEMLIEKGSLVVSNGTANEENEIPVTPIVDLAGTELLTQVTHEAAGVTYHFDREVEVGRYWNGDIFVFNDGEDITFEKITPESNEQGVNRVTNGTQIQPGNNNSQGFDSVSNTNMNYLDELNVDPGNTQSSLVVKYGDYPNGASIVKSISKNAPVNSTNRSSIEEFSILTIVSEIPPENAFRPPVQGGDKISYHSLNDLDFGKLQNVDLVEGHRSIDAFSEISSAAFVSWVSGSEGPRAIHPSKYHEGYGDYQMDRLVDGFIALHSDYTNDEKLELYAAFVQMGLDYAGAVENGVKWIADGGHNNVIKPFVVLAGVALNSETIKNLANPVHNAYSEDKQFFYVDEEVIGGELFNFVGNKNPQIGNEYQTAHFGIPEWRVSNDGRENPALDTAYRWHNADNSPVTALVIEMLGSGEGRDVWDHEAYFDYADRINHIFQIDEKSGTHSPEDAWLNFVEEYASEFGTQPDWVGVPESVSGISVKPNGAGLSVEIDGYKFDGGSEITRTDFRYSIDRTNWNTLHDIDSSLVISDLPENTLFYYQARYVNQNGEGPWSGNSLLGDNYSIVSQLLSSKYISDLDIENNGGDVRQYVKSDHYRYVLREMISGPNEEYARLVDQVVSGTAITSTGLSLGSGSLFLDENVVVGTIVGTLPSLEQSGSESTYKLLGDNIPLELDGYDLVTTGTIDYEQQSTYVMNIEIMEGGQSRIEEIILNIDNVEEPVVDFTIDLDLVLPSMDIGTVVGRFSAYDDDGTYIRYFSNPNPKLDDAIFREYFEIVGDEIVVANPIDINEIPSEMSLRFIARSGDQNYGNILRKLYVTKAYEIDAIGDAAVTICADDVAVINLIDQVTDPDGDTVSITSISDADETAGVGESITLEGGGIATLNANGTVSFNPNGAYDDLLIREMEMDQFSFTAEDGGGGSDTALADIKICGALNTIETIAEGFVDANDSSLRASYRVVVEIDTTGASYFNAVTAETPVDPRLEAILGSDGVETFDDNLAYCIDKEGLLDFFVDVPSTLHIIGTDAMNTGNAVIADAVDQEENLDIVTWILNQGFQDLDAGTLDDGDLGTAGTAGQNYTFNEVQDAIWFFTDGDTVDTSLASGANSQEIIDLAMAAGEGFEAGSGDIVAVLFDPIEEDRQTYMVGVEFDALQEDCDCIL